MASSRRSCLKYKSQYLSKINLFRSWIREEPEYLILSSFSIKIPAGFCLTLGSFHYMNLYSHIMTNNSHLR